MKSRFNSAASDKLSLTGGTMTGNIAMPEYGSIYFAGTRGYVGNSASNLIGFGSGLGKTGYAIVVTDNIIFPRQCTTALAPVYAKGGIYFDTTLNSLMVGGASALVALATLAAARDAPHIINKAASANVRNSHDAEATSTSASYVKVKTITLSNGLVGQQRFLFDLKTSDAGTPETAYGRIYRNGVALGSEQTDVTGGYVTKSEDITQTWNPGDTCELWVKIGNGDTVSVQNFRIAYDDSANIAVASANS